MRIIIPTLGANKQALWTTISAYRMTAPYTPISIVCDMQGAMGYEFSYASTGLELKFDKSVDLIQMDENTGFASAVNAGINAYPDDDLLISNDDVVPLLPGWAEMLEARLAERTGKVAAIGGVSNNVLRHQLHTRPGPELSIVPTLSFFWILITREGIDKVGLLDEDFGLGGYEDIEWCIRAKQAGMELVLDRNLMVWHWGQQTLNEKMMDDLGGHWDHQKALLELKHPDYETILAKEPT